jgi:predicted ester cyclase
MRIAKALVLVLVAACGGSQDAPTTVTTGPEGPAPDDPAVTTGEETPVETPAPKPEPPKPLTLEERIAFHDGCFKSFLAEEPDFFTRCYTEDSSDELVDSGDPVANGVAGIAASSKPFWDGFTLTGAGVLNLGNGDNVISVAVISATHDGVFNGMPATNKTSSLLVAEVQNLDDKGRHGDVRTYVDLGTMMGQLGMAPKGAKVRKPAAVPAEPVRTIVATGAESETANVDAVRVGFDLFNKHDWKALTAVYAADAVLSDQSAPADYAGSKAIEKQFKEIGKAFPDVKEEITAIWGAGDYVVAESTLTGTNKAAAPGRGIKKATKKPVTLRTAHVFQMEGGKVKQHWLFANGMAMAMQLGLIKPPAAAKPAEKAAEPAAEKTDKPADKSDKKPAKKDE